MTLHLDFETKSTVDLKKTGVYVYAENPNSGVWCMAWALGYGPVQLWLPGDPIPEDFADHIASGGTLTAHNAAFERVIWKYILTPRYGFPAVELKRWRCTMAMAYAMALPGSLGQLAEALKSDIKKDEQGQRLMLQMAKPRGHCKTCVGSGVVVIEVGTYGDGDSDFVDEKCSTCGGSGVVWWNIPEKTERLFAYCMQDVEAERAVEKRLLPLSEKELALWHLDQAINDRGVNVDTPLCNAATSLVDELKKDLDFQMAKVTDHEVTGCTNRNQFVRWLSKRVKDVDSVNKEALAELLARDDLPKDARLAIELRREGAKAATSKIDALLNGKSADGRAKGLLQYHATVTGRWAGRRFQPQNIRRPKIKAYKTLISAIATGDKNLFTMLYDDPLSAVGDAVRNLVTAASGRKFCRADYSNIEGRVAAWYAGEDWKIEAFSAFDRHEGADLYKLAYSKSFGVPVEEVEDDSNERQIGKVMELSLQYQGGHGAFVAMGANYGVKPDDVTPIVKAATDPEVFEKALSRFRPQNGFGMKPETWAALRVLIDGWRAAHPKIKQTWADLEEAAKSAIEFPGDTFSVGSVKFKKSGSFLFMKIPSGRALCFPYPKIKDKKMPWTQTVTGKGGKEDEVEVYKPSLCYMGVDSYTNQWSEQFAYGGQIFNYVVQGTARDIMAEAMFRSEAKSYPIVLTVHDEIVSEPRFDHGSIADFKKIMAEVPTWAAGCPIACDGWEGDRYRK
ncbi:MAG: DNA polymerase [Aestuariivirga sp.]